MVGSLNIWKYYPGRWQSPSLGAQAMGQYYWRGCQSIHASPTDTDSNPLKSIFICSSDSTILNMTNAQTMGPLLLFQRLTFTPIPQIDLPDTGYKYIWYD